MLDAVRQGAFSFQLRADANESAREAMVLLRDVGREQQPHGLG
jgi:hypothetical protein